MFVQAVSVQSAKNRLIGAEGKGVQLQLFLHLIQLMAIRGLAHSMTAVILNPSNADCNNDRYDENDERGRKHNDYLIRHIIRHPISQSSCRRP